MKKTVHISKLIETALPLPVAAITNPLLCVHG